MTPDSFSDGGRFVKSSKSDTSVSISHDTTIDIDALLKESERMIDEGADILDIGGESTRPDADKVSADEEMARVIPAIEAIASHFDTPISIDTYKAKVALAAVSAGARLINDIWGLQADADMPATVADIMNKYPDSAVCIMHNRRPVGYSAGSDIPITRHGEATDYGYGSDFISDVCLDLAGCIKTAVSAGISPDRIILDPGVGFAKTYEQNLSVMKHMDALSKISIPGITSHGYPILLGCSRKSVIGMTLDATINDRLYGTLSTTAYAAMQGIDFVRVHDIAPNRDVIKMIEALKNA